MNQIRYDLQFLDRRRVTWSRAMMARILAEQQLEQCLREEQTARIAFYNAHDQFLVLHKEDSKPLRWINRSGKLCVSTASGAR